MSQSAAQPTPALGSRRPLQERVAAAILEAAARVLAAPGKPASMTDVAVAAGVARATLYRYFPTRQQLLDELAALALEAAHDRLTSARLAEVLPEEGVRRAVRALVEVGDYFVVLARERVHPVGEEFEAKVGAPVRMLVQRAQASGDMRSDLPAAWLAGSLIGLVTSILSAAPALGREDTIAAIGDLFLDGARGRVPSAPTKLKK